MQRQLSERGRKGRRIHDPVPGKSPPVLFGAEAKEHIPRKVVPKSPEYYANVDEDVDLEELPEFNVNLPKQVQPVSKL